MKKGIAHPFTNVNVTDDGEGRRRHGEHCLANQSFSARAEFERWDLCPALGPVHKVPCNTGAYWQAVL